MRSQRGWVGCVRGEVRVVAREEIEVKAGLLALGMKTRRRQRAIKVSI